MPFQDSDGNVALPVLTPEGAVPVEEVDEGEVPDLLLRIYRELREQRRLYCEANSLLFIEELK